LTLPPLGVVVAILGLAIGSFLNVVIYRLPRRQSLVWPGSACPQCGTAIRWHDNIPVAGWVMLRGRCRACGGRISVRYPIVEIVTMLAFLAAWWQTGENLLLVPRLVLIAALIVLFAIDLEHQLLPNAITLPGIVAGVLFSLLLPPGIRDSLIGIVVGGGVLWAIGELWFRLRGMEAMGFGDVKMLAMVGAFLGWKLVVVTFVLSSLIGGVAAILLLVSGRTTWTSRIPYGTFLALAAFIAALWGQPLMDWYLSLYI
jgi:leader peptidase (prepilin peptidase)/N-methyltransferase